MLIEFRVANHRSIREEQVLSMEAASIGDSSDVRPRAIEGAKKPLLPVIAIYGANASGKSNVLDAIAFMVDKLQPSMMRAPYYRDSLRIPFASTESKSSPSLFEIVFVCSGVRYQYGFAIADQRIVEEWLYAFPTGRKQTWLRRELDEFYFGKHFQGENSLISSVTRDDSLFLSVAAGHKHSQIAQIHSWLNKLPQVGAWTFRLGSSFSPTSDAKAIWSFYYSECEHDDRLLDLLKVADLGIEKIIEDPSKAMMIAGTVFRLEDTFEFKHAGAVDRIIPWKDESHGTQTLFSLGPRLLACLQRGGRMLIDELEASLHPLLAVKIVELFNNPETNPKNAQLIFTTHDTNLLGTTLGEPVLRRDQVWFTEKNPEGATELYPLTDYKPRNVENLERGYLQGRYGAIPFLGDFESLTAE